LKVKKVPDGIEDTECEPWELLCGRRNRVISGSQTCVVKERDCVRTRREKESDCHD